MSQEQPRRPEQVFGQEPITYGDVFPVVGDLAGQPVAPRDAAMMQAAENTIIGETPKGLTASVMDSAVRRYEQRGLVGHDQASDIPAQQGVFVTQTEIPGSPDQSVVTEFVAGQAVATYVLEKAGGCDGGNQGGGGSEGGYLSGSGDNVAAGAGTAMWTNKITMGQALEAAAKTAGCKPIEQSDAAAIQAAESIATGMNLPGGIAAAAQSAAAINATTARNEDKTKLRDILAVKLTFTSTLCGCNHEATREGGYEGGRGKGGRS